MTTSEDTLSPWRLGTTLAAGFFLIILLGLLGYLQTVRAMQESARRSHQIEARIDACIFAAKDVALHSHESAFFTQSYLYSGNPGDRDQKWEAQTSTDVGFAGLAASLKALPDSETLQADCAAAEQQNRTLCEAQEAREIMLAGHNRRAEAVNLLQTEGTASRDNLEFQLEALIGVNTTQDTDAALHGLTAYRAAAQTAENRTSRRQLLLGEAVQGAILLLSLLVAVLVIRTASAGVRTVLTVQENLRESEGRYRLLFESNPQPMFVYARETLRYLAVNEAAVQKYGHSREEFAAMTIMDIRPPEDQSLLRETLAETLGVGLPLTNSVWRHRKRDGSLLWAEITSHPMLWSKQAAAMVIAQDITARREAEAGLNHLAAIVSSSNDAIVGWNPDKTITSWNPGAKRLYGWTEAEMLGRSIAGLMPDDSLEESAAVCKHLEAGEPIELTDTLRRHKSGKLLEVWVSSSPIKNAAGEIIGASTISRSISEQKKASALIRWQAYNDPLTRLPNRAFFHQALEEAIERAAPFAVVFVDLDQFKHVNDSLGHAAGDRFLKEAAARFERCLQKGDLLARMGGDEFTLLLPGDKEKGKEGETRAEVLLQALAAPVTLEGHELHIAASIGISRFPADGCDAETLLKHADLAMYQAKERGRSRWQVFSPALTEAARERLTLESSLRKAVERDELILLYQPQVSLTTGEIIGTEALVRWMHPELGLVAPGRFIPLAEETGLIVPIGEWVLHTACRQAALWAREGRNLRQSVNLSARQLAEPGLVKMVEAVLRETGLDPRLLDLELTESALVAQGEAAVVRLAALREIGVRVSLDDFGTGYSSLAYLRRFPLDILKVDRAFVLELGGSGRHARQDQAVVHAIVSMAHSLELKVVAEGVETAAQFETLQRLGCDYMQGFLYSPPVAPEALETLLPAVRQSRQRQAA